jgi:hypothetical protein
MPVTTFEDDSDCYQNAENMFQKLAEINLLFSDNDYVLYIYLLTMQ